MTPKLVIFDCDGVLVDTEPTTDKVLAENLTSHGLPIAPSEVHRLFAGGTMQGVIETARKKGANLPDDWLDHIYAEVFDALREGVPVIPGVMDLLDQLERQGIAVAVASNGPMQKMRISLGPSGLWQRLQGRIYSREDHAPKPKPDMLLHAMRMAGVTPAQTVMIDDMPAGWNAARAAGVRALAYVADGGLSRATGDVTGFTQMSQVPGLIGLADRS